MKSLIEDTVKIYLFCQKYKIYHRYYGHLPPKNVQHLNPWDKIHVDIVPWKIIINKFVHQFRAVTYIDAVINLPEAINVDNARSKIVANACEDNWLSRYQYPSPTRCIHNNGNELLGPDFVQMRPSQHQGKFNKKIL